MLKLGVQTKNIIHYECPQEGFSLLKKAGFSCADFSLNRYLLNTSLYQSKHNHFFDQTQQRLEQFFTPHKQAAKAAQISIHQMHMPYPIYVPKGSREINDYLRKEVAPKSLGVCRFFGCNYMVVHEAKLAYYLGSEEAQWKWNEEFLGFLAPMAKEMGITLCVENLYEAMGGHLVEGPCCNARKAAERIDRFNEKYQAEVLGFCFDTGHANIVGLDMESFLAVLGERLKVLHIHDNDGVSDLHQVPFTFTRTRENRPSTDWEGFIRGLKRIGFDRVLSFETAPVLDSFPDEMKGDVLAFLAKIGEYFAGCMERQPVNGS